MCRIGIRAERECGYSAIEVERPPLVVGRQPGHASILADGDGPVQPESEGYHHEAGAHRSTSPSTGSMVETMAMVSAMSAPRANGPMACRLAKLAARMCMR